MLHVFIDADACPVKDEVYRVALRYDLAVSVVTNVSMRVPRDGRVTLVVVSEGFDAADDWIVERAEKDDVVVTGDVPLAARCLAKGARVIGPKGRPFTEASIGDALAGRELKAGLREMGVVTGGPAPFSKADRSRFLGALDDVVQGIRRGRQ